MGGGPKQFGVDAEEVPKLLQAIGAAGLQFEGFHLYAIDWTKDKMDFLVDGKVYHTVLRDPKDDFKGWPFDQKFYLIMNIAVGGGWGGREGVDLSIWPQHMEIDYVRVYQ